jgi:patatin-related protein
MADEFDEDLRIAVVMNGGVSLAIWIGGVSQELNRLARSRDGDGSVYARLRELVRCTARVDVIAGTSAGGINGGFLALATAYDAPLDPLGDIWADDGGLLDLLRSPTEGNAVSLLRGDDYFLPELRKAFDKIAPPYVVGTAKALPPSDAPVNLTMTASVVNGTLRRFEDDFGTRIVEVEHKGRLSFVRGELEDGDPFVRPSITAELALAARSTASFPIAFEPSFVPVGENAGDLHPDMRGIANFDLSRYVLDGGVLLNKPVRPALDAIAVQPARRQVRRVLAYVVPDPGAPVEAPPDVHGSGMPSAAKVLADTLVTLPRAQSIAEELEEIRLHNREARERGLAGAELAPLLGATVLPLAESLFGVYRVVRARRAVAHIADVVAPRTASADPAGPQPWTYAELLVAFGVDGDELAFDLPFVPRQLAPGETWDWGLAPAERIGWSVLDVLRRAIRVAPIDDPVRPALAEYRGQVHDVLHSLRRIRADDTTFWQARADALGPPPADPVVRRSLLAGWVRRSVEVWPVVAPPEDEERRVRERDWERDGLGFSTRRLVELLVDAAPLVAAAAAEREPEGDRWLADEADRVRDILEGLGLLAASRAGSETELAARLVRAGVPEGAASAAATASVGAAPRSRSRRAVTGVTNDAVARCLQLLLALDVAELAISGAPAKHLDPVDLVQVSGDTPNGFGGPQTVADKLAGVQLGHFGAFYKRSWRVNDWTWGRVDGATRIVQILLDPVRLRRLYRNKAQALVDALHDIAVGGPKGEELEARWQEDLPAIVAQVAYLDDENLEPPPALTVAAYAVARRIQAEVLDVELPRLAAAVDSDRRQGAGGRGAGAELAAAYAAAVAAGDLGPDALLTLFARSRIATEQITDEAGTDLFARTVSKAAAVAVSTADGKHSGLGGARALTRALRGFTLVLYALVAGATRGSRVGAWFVNAALATGGALLAVALLAPKVAGPVKLFAAVLVLAGLALSALRARTWVLALVIAFPMTVVLALALAPDGVAVIRDHGTVIGVVAGLVVALMVVGSVRTPGRPPFPVPRQVVLRWVAMVALVLVFGCLTWWAAQWMQQVRSPDLIGLEVRSWTRARAASRLVRWAAQPGGLARGRANVVRDYAFLAVYWVPISVAVAAAGRGVAWAGLRRRKPAGPHSIPGRLAAAAVTIAWLPLVAAFLDAAENALLLGELHQYGSLGHAGFVTRSPAYLPALETTVSVWKWVLLILSALYVVAGLLYLAFRAVVRLGGTPPGQWVAARPPVRWLVLAARWLRRQWGRLAHGAALLERRIARIGR